MNDETVTRSGGTQSPDRVSPIPTDVPGYQILGEVGHGGMGIVYRARDLELDREVAVKFLQDKFAPDSPTAARFLDEAHITGQLQHPGIPPVYRVGRLSGGRPFLAMKLIKGQTLESKMKSKAELDPLAVVEAVARAVGYAHAHGVIHRDLKPANIMVGSFGEYQVMDWGLAKVLTNRGGEGPGSTSDSVVTVAQTEIRAPRDSDTQFTQYGSVLGTPAYMAPEQAAGELEKVDCRSDVFGVGAILCALLTGEPPFTGKDAEAVRIAAMRGKSNDAFARLDRSGAEPDVIALCKRCLAFEPSARPATATEVATAVAALRQAADARARHAEHDRMAAELRATEQIKRRRLTMWAAGVIAAVLLLGIAGTIWGLARANDARHLAEQRQSTAEFERGVKEQALLAEEAAARLAWNSQIAAEQREQEAKDAREVATQQRRLALETVRAILLRVDELMKNNAKLAPLRIEIIRRMLADVDQIRDHALNNPLEDRTEAIAYSKLGEIYYQSNRIEDAKLCFDKAYSALEKVAKDTPDDPNAMRNLAAISHQLADAEWRLGNGNRARELHVAALELRRKRLELIKNAGPDKDFDVATAEQDVAESLNLVAYADLRAGDPVSAIEHYSASDRMFAKIGPPTPATLKVRRIRLEIMVRLGDAYARLGKLDEAEKYFRDSLAERERLLENTPRLTSATAMLQTDVGQGRMYLGDFLLMFRKDRKAAAAEYVASLDIFATQLNLDPDNLDLQQRLGAAYYRIGMAETDPKKAMEAYAKCLKVRQVLASIDPRDTQSGVELALALARTGQETDAEKMATSLLQQAAKDRQVLFQVVCTLSVIAGSTTDKETAARCREKAVQVLRDLIQAGWKDRGALDGDPDLDAMRNDSRFVELVNGLWKPTETAPPRRPEQ